LNRGLSLNKEQRGLICAALKRRMEGEPLAYILGKSEFMGLEFKVNQDVLIPRPETEVLVEKVMSLVISHKSQVTSLRILDIGTGSGCIAVSLAKMLPGVEVTATDISQRALAVAFENSRLNGVSENIRFIKSDLFANDGLRTTKYDIIVSNPAYVRAAEIDELQPEVRREPRLALDGGEDGLDFYRKIIQEAGGYLEKGGLLIMEIGFNQAREIKKIFQKYGNFTVLEAVKDYNNIERVIVAKNG